MTRPPPTSSAGSATELDTAVARPPWSAAPRAQNHDLTAALTGTAPSPIVVIMIVAFVLLLVVFRSLTIAVSSLDPATWSAWPPASASPPSSSNTAWGAGCSASSTRASSTPGRRCSSSPCSSASRWTTSCSCSPRSRSATRPPATPRLAVREGIARTGRPITNAALIMIVVFIAFGVTGPIPPTELGITLALAVLLDATVIRMMLVPSLLGLLGERGWWIPRWLATRLPQVRFSH